MPPVKVGQKITEYIFSAPEGKDRIIKDEGYIIFVPTNKNVKESITVEITKVFLKYAFAVEINKEADENVR